MSTDTTAADGGSREGERAELSEAERQELIDQLERRRNPRGIAAVAVVLVGIAFSAFQMWLAARGTQFAFTLPFVGRIDLIELQLLQANAVHVAFGLMVAFLLYPPSTGDGALSTRLGRIVPVVENRLGSANPGTRALRGARSVVRWALVDSERNRVTPADLVSIAFAFLAGLYMLTSFDEVQAIRVFGFSATRTIGEIVPMVEPLASVSVAFFLGVVGVLLVLEATRRALGFFLMAIVAAFVVYARYGYLIPADGVVSTPFGFGIAIPAISVLAINVGDWGTIIQNFWYNTENGVFGIPVTVSVRFIYIFILFGAYLEMSGAGQWFIDLAYALTGHRKGGPAKASVLSSGFMGTISGSSIANTVTTGAFTIPLMKRTGYRAEFAGAVEASASSGGQILPPVMGAAAFLIVQYTGISYSNVIIAAAIPALVFFFGVWVMVHLEASREGIARLSREDTIPLRPHLKKGWFYLVPIVLLLYFLIIARLSVARSAWLSLVAIIATIAIVAAYNERNRLALFGGIAGLFAFDTLTRLVAGASPVGVLLGSAGVGQPITTALAGAGGDLGTIAIVVSALVLLARPHDEAPLLDYDDGVDEAAEIAAGTANRPSLAGNNAFRLGTFVIESMAAGARTATPIVIAVAAVGIVPGVISATGLGPNLTAFITTLAGGSLVLLLLITAIAAIILGMGVPTTATYILLAATLVPALLESGEIPELAAHMFILYFGVIADITPPVAVAAYAASGVAKSDPFGTGVQAFSLSLNKAIVPFAFVLTPGILLLRRTGGDGARVIGFGDVLDVGFFVPEVLIPVVCVFIGVLALGPTIIGYFYAAVSRGERALFALSAILLMAPLTFFTALADAMGAVSPYTMVAPPFTGLVLRGVGLVLFAALVAKNRRSADERPGVTADVEPTEPTTDD